MRSLSVFVCVGVCVDVIMMIQPTSTTSVVPHFTSVRVGLCYGDNVCGNTM